MTKKTTLATFAFGLVLGTGTVLAQSTNGTLRGEVLDPSGALIPEAQVTISNSNGFSETISSGSTGTFEASELAPGSYSVSINALGFTSALESGIEVSADKVTLEDVKLGISVDSEVDVFADDSK